MSASYKVPQNVDLEDKIFGPLTLKQFLMALGAGMVSFVWSSMFLKSAPGLFYLLTFSTWAIAIMFIFVRPYDQPFTKFFFSFVAFALKPQRRVWKRLPSLDDLSLSTKPVSEPPKIVAEPTGAELKSRLQKLSYIVDTRGWGGVEDDDAQMGDRVTGGEYTAKMNVEQDADDQPEDILRREDEATGSDRATADLERLIHSGVSKPRLKHDPGKQQPNPTAT